MLQIEEGNLGSFPPMDAVIRLSVSCKILYILWRQVI